MQHYFNSGAGWLPIGQAPADIRWAPNSGTGNYTASQFTHYAQGTWGMYGSNNTGNTGDEGHTIFNTGQGVRFRGRMVDGILTHVPTTYDPRRAFHMSQKPGAPTLYATPDSVNAYNSWLMQQPEYKAWAVRNGRDG